MLNYRFIENFSDTIINNHNISNLNVNFIWVRHGLSCSNTASEYYRRKTNDYYLGKFVKEFTFHQNKWSHDSDLTPYGIKQAIKVGKIYNKPIDLLCSSNLVRAIGTASYIGENIQINDESKRKVYVLPNISEVGTYVNHGARSLEENKNYFNQKENSIPLSIDYKYINDKLSQQPCNFDVFMNTTAIKLVNDLHKQYPNKTDFNIMIVSHGGFLGRNLPRKLYKKSVNSHKINNTAIWKLEYSFNNNNLTKKKEWAEQLYDGGRLADYNEYNKQFQFCDFD